MNLILGLMCLAVCSAKVIQQQDWHLWKSEHGKTYPHLGAERVRFEIWQDNMNRIEEHNNGNHSYTQKMNHLGDLTNTEYRDILSKSCYQMSTNKTGSAYLRLKSMQIPKAVDWREKGLVNPVKNQRQCGSCYAFSTTGSLEGQWARKTGKLVSLSEQQIVDCDKVDHGCYGGLMDNAFAYIKENGGIDTEESYPYLARKQKQCQFNKKNVAAQVTGHVDILAGDEDALTEAIATIGPISVAIDAGQQSFQFYHEGVYDEPNCSSRMNHAVLAVGYGTMPWGVFHGEKDFYWVKNSWGAMWGLNGYVRMSRNNGNQCGIATSASYPLV